MKDTAAVTAATNMASITCKHGLCTYLKTHTTKSIQGAAFILNTKSEKDQTHCVNSVNPSTVGLIWSDIQKFLSKQINDLHLHVEFLKAPYWAPCNLTFSKKKYEVKQQDALRLDWILAYTAAFKTLSKNNWHRKPFIIRVELPTTKGQVRVLKIQQRGKQSTDCH